MMNKKEITAIAFSFMLLFLTGCNAPNNQYLYPESAL